MLYILIFLHQTATNVHRPVQLFRCISLYSYIKPQHNYLICNVSESCISLYSYIKPQPYVLFILASDAVYPYIPTSNRNLAEAIIPFLGAVYPYIPTSNRNRLLLLSQCLTLYILIFLHQTATGASLILSIHGLYILIFLHQTATGSYPRNNSPSCISLYSYIKPQPKGMTVQQLQAVYPYIPTSNRNHGVSHLVPALLYILIFLHQTATLCRGSSALLCCISLYSYIKPQLQRGECACVRAVYPYIPTSNRNPIDTSSTLHALYILIFLHQTATASLDSVRANTLYILIFLHQTATGGNLTLLIVTLYILIFLHQTATRNNRINRNIMLYILIFLHQTATVSVCCVQRR